MDKNININQKDLLESIKQEILRIHPLKKPRKYETDSYSVMEIYITFGATYDNKPLTAIGFLDGNENSRSSTSNFYRLDEYVDFAVINQLIVYLLTEYSTISDFSLYSTSFSLSFEYPFENKEQEGISCDKIILEFNAHSREFTNILNEYLANIMKSFTEELSNTEIFQRKYSEYCDALQRNIINSLNDEKIDKLIQELPHNLKRYLLRNISSSDFLKFYAEHQNWDEEQMILKINKKIE